MEGSVITYFAGRDKKESKYREVGREGGGVKGENTVKVEGGGG